MKKYLLLIMALLVMLVSCAPKDPLQLNLKDYNQLALHLHPHLDIIINGKNITIPANIGHSETVIRGIHTHDADGIIHVESPVVHQYVLQDFFTVWGKTFNETCILEYCVDEKHTLTVTVNGEKSNQYGQISLHDQDNIQISYEQKQE